jgi:hypothetical protein
MNKVEGAVRSTYFLCLDCWYEYFQSVDEIPSAPFKGQCSACRYNIGPLILCTSDSPLARRHPWWEDGNDDRRSNSFFGPGAVPC